MDVYGIALCDDVPDASWSILCVVQTHPFPISHGFENEDEEYRVHLQ